MKRPGFIVALAAMFLAPKLPLPTPAKAAALGFDDLIFNGAPIFIDAGPPLPHRIWAFKHRNAGRTQALDVIASWERAKERMRAD